jgi:hypothetical protein
MPLKTFNKDEAIVVLDFVESTSTYAFTIENEGGSKTPNMDQLFGTVSIE